MIDLGINLFQEIAALGGGGGFNITNSLRFNDDDSAYLSRTPSVAGNRKTWTWSGWVKRGNLGSRQFLFTCADVNAQNSLYFEFSNNDEINIADYNTNWVWQKTTTGVFRDVSGWYHIVLRYDTTESTASDRIKLYVNGAQVTAFGTNTDPSLNYDGFINTTTNPHRIGSINAVSLEFDGYMAEVNFIDGQALTADDFGEINEDTGEWSPKRYSGTYGTNGFYLPFNGNANDDSGNGNNWTENNLASTDYMIDTPTNNFSVLNPLDKSTATILSEGNLKTSLSSPPGGDVIAYGTVGVSSGKWYMETTLNDFSYPVNGAAGIFGMHDGSNRVGATYSTGITSWYAYSEGAFTALSFNGSAIGMVMQIAIDLDAGKLWVGKDGVWNGSGDPDTGANPDRTFTPSGTYKMSAEPYRDGVGYWLLTVNAGADSSFAGLKTRQGNTDANGKGDFYYTPPAGYLALCTDNLPAPAIEQPETQFNVVTYTGDGTSSRSITGVGFQPDLVWTKARSVAYDALITDSVRGSGRSLTPSNTNAEVIDNGNGYVGSFDGDGFTLTQGFSSIVSVNESGQTYVAWCWKAGGTAVSNTDGVTSGVFTAVTSQVSANVDSGFSIQTYTAPASGKPSWGHGLGVTPKVLILKRRDGTGNWEFISPELIGASYGLRLNTTAAATNYTNNYAFFDSSKIDIGNATYNLTGSADYVAYTFAEVESFSKFGSYVGNGSANGPFVYTGFKPAFVMVKRTDSTANWNIWDKERSDYNPANDLLQPDSSAAEYVNLTAWDIDLVSNGFKVRGTNQQVNASGANFIYMAFAEHPFKEALAR